MRVREMTYGSSVLVLWTEIVSGCSLLRRLRTGNDVEACLGWKVRV
jgi:hypothetical protein